MTNVPATRSAAIAVDVADPFQMAFLEMSDLGNAERLRMWASGKLLYVQGWGWMYYDGQRWNGETGERNAYLLAHTVARNMRTEIKALGDAISSNKLPDWCVRDIAEERLLSLRKWAVSTGMAAKTSGMLEQAKHEMAAEVDEFDTDKFALNVQNGTLLIRKGDDGRARITLRGHDPQDRFTRVCSVDYDPKAACPAWRERLEKIQPVTPIREFFQEVIGYSFTGSNREQLFFMHQGRGGDGKSATLNLLREIAGGYGLNVDVKTFLVGPDRSAADASPDLFRMQGDARFITCPEPKLGAVVDDNRVKAFTGGNNIETREPFGRKIVSYVPRGKPHMEVNNRPRIPGADDGIWRRICFFPWTYQFSKAERQDADAEIAVLTAEMPGILNWVLEGMIRWIERGHLVIPREIEELVEDYRRSANPFGDWFMERVDLSNKSAVTPSSELYDDYKRHCEENAVGDREIMSSTAFGRALGDKQLIKFKGGDGRVLRRGAMLRPKGDAQGQAAPPIRDNDPLPPSGGGSGDFEHDGVPGWGDDD